ncbi:hypothetical protein ACOMHN_008201 [Nucella lapillus]
MWTLGTRAISATAQCGRWAQGLPVPHPNVDVGHKGYQCHSPMWTLGTGATSATAQCGRWAQGLSVPQPNVDVSMRQGQLHTGRQHGVMFQSNCANYSHCGATPSLPTLTGCFLSVRRHP